MHPTEDTVVRVTADRQQANEWSLVLTSAGIAHTVLPHLAQWAVTVASGEGERARGILDSYDRENRREPASTAAVVEYGATYAGIVVALALLGFHVVVWSGRPTAWLDAGAATAARILKGEYWRALTALTLHTGAAHVAGNTVSCAIFATALCRSVGPGVGLWLMLLAGAGGNVLNALVRGAPHSAVGASTAIFGAVGALGALQFAARSRRGATRWRAWVPIAAALGLLAMLGSGSESDVLAHLFGFLAGAVLGIVTSVLPLPGRAVQVLLSTTAAAAVVAAWIAAR